MIGLRKNLAPLTTFIAGGSYPIRTLVLELLVAMSLAFLVWLYTHSREESSLDHVDVPVNITLTPGLAGKYKLQINGSSRIPMSFAGPPSRMRDLRRRLQRGQLQVAVQVSVPEENQNDNVYHDVIHIDPESVDAPPGVVTMIAPEWNNINFSLHRLVERHLPVQLDYTGDMRISEVKLEPATVMVRGPKEILDHARTITTQPYDLTLPANSTPGGDGFIRGQASLISELEGRPMKTTPSSVSVRLKAQPRKKQYQLKDVPIRFLCPPNFAWTPRFVDPKMSKINIEVRGPAADEPPRVLAFVDLSSAGVGSGRNVQPLRIHIPGEYKMTESTSRLISFYLDPVDCIEPFHGR